MKNFPMLLSGDQNVPAIPLTDSQVNHLRRLLAWMRTEYMLDEDMQRGFLQGATEVVNHGFTTPDRAFALLEEQAANINRVPKYVQQAVKMLTKALRDHDRESGIVEGS